MLVTRDDTEKPWRTLHDEESGIALSHPAGWMVQTFGRHCRRVGPGVLVANVADHTFRRVQVVDGCTSQWDLAGLPSNYVVVDISLFSRPPVPEQAETPLPLALAHFGHGPDGTAFKAVRRNGVDYTVWLRFGPTASQLSQEEATRLIRSLEFRPPARDGG